MHSLIPLPITPSTTFYSKYTNFREENQISLFFLCNRFHCNYIVMLFMVFLNGRFHNRLVSFFFPNPAKEVVNVQCTMNNVQLTGELSVFDVYGKLLQIVSITSEITPVNVSGLADGMYFVRVTTEKGAVTKTFVKK